MPKGITLEIPLEDFEVVDGSGLWDKYIEYPDDRKSIEKDLKPDTPKPIEMLDNWDGWDDDWQGKIQRKINQIIDAIEEIRK